MQTHKHEMRLPGGISLSPAFVVMFAMQYYNLSWEDALHMVQNRRYCISPNGGFLTQIKVRNLFVVGSHLVFIHTYISDAGVRVDLQGKECRCCLSYDTAAGL